MTGPGAEEEIQEYGEHYCQKCGGLKSWSMDRLCWECAELEPPSAPPRPMAPMVYFPNMQLDWSAEERVLLEKGLR